MKFYNFSSFRHIAYHVGKVYVRGIFLSTAGMTSISCYYNYQEKKKKAIKDVMNKNNATNNNTTNKNNSTDVKYECSMYKEDINELIGNVFGWGVIMLAWPVTIPLISIMGGSQSLLFWYLFMIILP